MVSNKKYIDVVKETYGFTTKEAKEYVKKAKEDGCTNLLEELVRGFNDNAKRCAEED